MLCSHALRLYAASLLQQQQQPAAARAPRENELGFAGQFYTLE
jgi:hypothetical protein